MAARGEGSFLWDVDGTRYLDLYGGHAVALLGHNPPRVSDALARQARELFFYSNVVH
ncbi:MAG: aminotransferase class III-fold pyridoxal phosphate-dependent enzyme, partial [Planctomycetota bacterium]